MRIAVFSIAILFLNAATGAADTLITTKGPYTWSDDCQQQVKVTLRVYKDVAGSPGYYRWDYTIQNVSVVSNNGDGYVNGISFFHLAFEQSIPELTGQYAGTNWLTSMTDPGYPATNFQAFSASGPDPAPPSNGLDQTIYAIPPGTTINVGFLTYPRPANTLSPCYIDGDGYIYTENCGSVYRAEVMVPGIAERREATRVRTLKVDGGRRTGGCAPFLTGQIGAPGEGRAKLISFGWAQSQRQPLWTSENFTSNGDEEIGETVWEDSDGDSIPEVDYPAAFVRGQQLSTLKNIVLQSSRNGAATLSVEVSPADFSFATTTITFANGQATAPTLAMATSFPSVIRNRVYTFRWSVNFGTGFEAFASSSHKIYLIHRVTDVQDPQYFRTTTTRMERVTDVANGVSDTDDIVLAISGHLVDTLGAVGLVHFGQGNFWTPIDATTSVGWDCESLASFAAVHMQQLGFVTANVGVAYPTGALPIGDTDATQPEAQNYMGDVLSLAFFGSPDYFEGFMQLDSPDTGELVAYTVFPLSEGRILQTNCGVSPGTIANHIRYGVLEYTYERISNFIQRWLWDDRLNVNPGRTPPEERIPPISRIFTSLGDFPLPLSNCQ